jgi:hypothetical protein
MKSLAIYALHYGKEYLAWSIRSVQDVVDQILVMYSDRPSFGHPTDLLCPDTKEELLREAHRFLKDPCKLVWIDGLWGNESQHRTACDNYALAEGFDTAVLVDADEVWVPETLRKALEVASGRDERNLRIRFCHLWRSFRWFCDDVHMPIKITNLKKTGEWYLGSVRDQPDPVYHFGCAFPAPVMAYKMAIHGHKAELRPGWMERFQAWTPGCPAVDLHPTCRDFWTPKRLEGKDTENLDRLMGDHPYRYLDMIL